MLLPRAGHSMVASRHAPLRSRHRTTGLHPRDGPTAQKRTPGPLSVRSFRLRGPILARQSATELCVQTAGDASEGRRRLGAARDAGPIKSAALAGRSRAQNRQTERLSVDDGYRLSGGRQQQRLDDTIDTSNVPQ